MQETLDQLSLNKWAEVVTVVPDKLTPILTDMGLYPGKKVKILFKAPLGDPIAIDVEGYTLSLRLKEAALVQVKPC
ncbi:FeoA family protein [Microscilla marina]|uniref:Conserved domain protein n=1 Tax=Microscilla marina ATCC 23134 TaxID=313606 RepID=A1ZTA3_MICM2|nr:FeoA family protein [Microscilla marina]EAY26325.1 conserved domain protein [Microscilla marina ATCC 23134]